MLFERPETGDRALLLQVELRRRKNPQASEFAELAKSAEIEVVGTVVAKRDMPHPRWFVGEGKLDEIRACAASGEISLVLVNHELTAGQQRNLEHELDCRVITRTELILTIFADRARSHEGQLQVELAQLKHAQSRLVRGWTHLDRQKGGIGMRGAGEKQIELDQRMLSERIKATEKKLGSVAQRRAQSRRGRNRQDTPTVSLVGYTNAGKSSIFNRLTNAGVYAEDQLFATLDPTLRRLVVPGSGEIILGDTVGFVDQLPHTLVEAFKSTLEEVAHSALLLHVVDIADPVWMDRIEQVNQVLAAIGAADIPNIIVYNKIDLLVGVEMPAPCPNQFSVSAHTGYGFDALTAQVGKKLGVFAPHKVVLEPQDGQTRAWLYNTGAVLGEHVCENGSLELTVQADQKLLGRLQQRKAVEVKTG